MKIKQYNNCGVSFSYKNDTINIYPNKYNSIPELGAIIENHEDFTHVICATVCIFENNNITIDGLEPRRSYLKANKPISEQKFPDKISEQYTRKTLFRKRIIVAYSYNYISRLETFSKIYINPVAIIHLEENTETN